MATRDKQPNVAIGTFGDDRGEGHRTVLPDGYEKTIGPTAVAFTHYWRIVAHLGGGRSEVFWGHAKSLREAMRKKTATGRAARQRGRVSYDFDVVELIESSKVTG